MRRLAIVVVLPLLSLWLTSPAGAQLAQGLTAAQIADEVAAEGSYLESSSSGELDDAIARANDSAIGFVWLDSDDDAVEVAAAVSGELAESSSSLRTVLVVTRSGIGAWSETVSTSAIDSALDASFNDFARAGAVGSAAQAAGNAAGIDRFVAGLSGENTTATTTGSSGSGSDSGGGGIGFGTILLIAAIGGGGFFLFRRVRASGKAKKEAAADLEADRDEIKEQLRDNADHVLSLGDRVIASKNAELQRLYEKASAAYQEVSQSIDGATTAAEVDGLDDQIDQAEWEFESIEAQLEGRPVPPSPAEVEAQAEREAQQTAPPGPPGRGSDQPALGPNESVIRGGTAPAPAPRRSRTRYQQPRRRGGMGGLGGGLGSILGSIVLGGGLGGGTSRRTSRRRSTGGSIGRSSSGGLGGGVLQRGGSASRSSRSSRSSSRSSGRGSGRSFGSKRGGGSGRRF